METTVTFDGGLNQDASKLLRKQNSYLDASNIRITTYEGSSNIAITNIKGNKFLTSIPDAPIVYKVTAGTISPSTYSVAVITISSIVLITTSMSETLQNIVDSINNSPLFLNFKAWLSEDGNYILITSQNGTPITNIGIVLGSGNVPTITTYLPIQTNLIPIGWTIIRDTIILLTTNETAKVPLSTGGVGQIWSLTYDEITLTPTITLLYNNYLNFTTYHPVSPSSIQGRYENSSTQRIYWTDNFNALRNFNTAAPNGFVLVPALLSSQAPIESSIPILDTIGTGTCKVGAYQAAYRMKNGTSVTAWSELSNIVFLPISTVPESQVSSTNEAHMNYIGAGKGTSSARGFTMVINNVDTNYERIEIAVLFRADYNGNPTTAITHDEFIVGTTFKFTYTGTELIEVLTNTDFFNQSFSFTHCKTISVKDNQLIAANVRHEKIDFTYDARAYRHPLNAVDLYLKDGQGNTYTFPDPGINGYTQVPETHDAINPSTITNAYRYKYNSNRLGGTGPNISYEFGTRCLMVDKSIELITGAQQSPFVSRDQNYNEGLINLGVSGQNYDKHNDPDGIKFSYKSGLLQSYQRNEVYRFGIVFYDRQNRPLFARWIGDIKMPDYGDTNYNKDACATTNSINDFRLSFQDSTYLPFTSGPSLWAQLLYIKFTVNIPPAIQSSIGGFRIVRVDRTKTDRTILGAGILNTMVSDGGQLFLPNPHSNAANIVSADMNISSPGRGVGQGSTVNFTFDSPDFLLAGYPGYGSSDCISICQMLGKANNTYDIQPNLGAERYRIAKEYNVTSKIPFENTVLSIEDAAEVGQGGTYTFSKPNSGPGWAFRNWIRMNANDATSDVGAGFGNKTVAIGLNTGVDLASGVYGCTTGSFTKAYALYYRPATNQYGGNTYSVRSHNTYMPCGSFQPIDDSTNVSSPFVQDVYGGDIYLDIYDNQKIIKNWGSSSVVTYSGPGAAKTSYTNIWVCESIHNTGLRHGIHMTHDLGRNAGASGEGSGGADTTETFDYNVVYSQVNNLTGYVPKPIDFIAIEEFDTRIWVSEQKQSGEVTDSWNIFLPAKYYDADAAYGPINCLLTFQDRVFFFQNSGYGIVPISERALLESGTVTNITELQLGKTAEVIQRPEYISRTIGSQHQWSVTTSKAAIYFFDINSLSLYKHNQQGPQTIDGLNGYFTTNFIGNINSIDNPVYDDPILLKNGINCTVDYVTNDVYYTFFDSQGLTTPYTQLARTITYNEDIQKLVSFITIAPSLYINTGHEIITPNTSNLKQLYVHNRGNYGSFYGTIFQSSVSTIINEHPRNSKMFTNLEWDAEVIDLSGPNPVNQLTETWTQVRCYNDFQITDYQNLTPNTLSKRRERTWRTPVPRNIMKTTGANLNIFDATNYAPTRLFKESLRDKYIVVELFYSNANNRRLICPLLTTKYLLSPR